MSAQQSKETVLRQVLVLTPFVFSFALGLDIYIPIIPQMATIFNTTPALVHLTLSLFLFITGFGQLLIGPLSDQFGRKPLFSAGAIAFALGSLLCALSTEIAILILGRAVSAFGACAMLVTSFALVRDQYSELESGKMYSFLNGAIGISPVFAPMIGGHLAVAYGWQSVFYFLAVMGLFALFVSKKFIHETLSPDLRVAMTAETWKRYREIFSNRQFLTYSLIGGFAESVFFCFFSISPFIIIDLHQVPTEQFGYYFAVFGSVIALGGVASGKSIGRFGIAPTIAGGIGMMFIGGAAMLACEYCIGATLAGFLLPMAIACTGAMFLVGGSAAMALEPFGEIAGTASAAFGALEFGIAALVGALLMVKLPVSTQPYGWTILLLSAGSLLLFMKKKEPSVSIAS